MSICYRCFFPFEGEQKNCPHCGFNYEEGRRKYPMALPYGTILSGEYLIGCVLGQGGFGITYRAKGLKDGKLYAIKEYVPRDLAIRNQDTLRVMSYSEVQEEGYRYGLRQFLNEAETLSRFSNSKNIVHIFNYFEENNTAYFSMELLQGESLKEYLSRQPGEKITWEHCLSLISPVMDALSEVHGTGLIHRDVSPDNIFITKDDEIKLIDFGATRFQAGAWSQSLSVILKPGYAPKEQYHKKGNQGAWTDIYALSATIYRAITGELPPEALERDDNDTLLPPSAYGISIPDYVEAAILKGLAVNSGGRWQTVEEFRKALITPPLPSPHSVLPKIAIYGGIGACIVVTLLLVCILKLSGPSQSDMAYEPSDVSSNTSTEIEEKESETKESQKAVEETTVEPPSETSEQKDINPEDTLPGFYDCQIVSHVGSVSSVQDEYGPDFSICLSIYDDGTAEMTFGENIMDMAWRVEHGDLMLNDGEYEYYCILEGDVIELLTGSEDATTYTFKKQ